MKIKEIWKNVSGKVSDFVDDHKDGIIIATGGICVSLMVIMGIKAGYNLGKYETDDKMYQIMVNGIVDDPDLTLKDFMKNHGMID